MSQLANDEFSQHLSDDEASNHDDASDTGTAPKQKQQVIPQTTAISNIKLPILKKEEYDIWAMEMEHYLEYIDNDAWKVIQNGNSKKRISTGKDGVIRILPPVTAAEIQAVEKERKAKNILLMAIPKEHMRRFHGMDDAKEIWEAIRTRFGGNANSKKMQKAVFKQQFEAFTISSSEGLEKGYDRFQQLLSQLEAHGAEVSTEDANYTFLRSLPPAWSNLAMTMRTKLNVDTLSIDDLYNNLRVFEQEIQGASPSAYNICTPTSSTNTPEKEALAGFADEIAMIAITNKEVTTKKTEKESSLRKSTSDQEAQILAYSQAVKKLEAQLVTFQKQQLSLNEKLTFQANEIYEKDEKLKKYRRIGMKAVKEKEQLQKTLDSWKDSSKNLWRLINSGMSSNSKVGLGYEIQSNNEVLSYEEEMNFSVFNCTEEDSVGKPLYSRFIKTNDFKGVPHPLSGDYTPKPQEEIDESLYVYGKKGPQEPEPSVSDDRSSEYSTCQSNDSAGSIGTSFEHFVDLESEISRVPQEVKNWNDMMERELGEGYSFTKKKCFICGSLSHLIKDCDYYKKKMAREAEFKKQGVFNTGNMVAKPIWTSNDRINHANQFVPRPVQLNAGRPNINSVRPNINIGRTNINFVRPRVNTVNSNINIVRSRQPLPTRTSNSFSPKRPQVNQFNQRREIGYLLLRPKQVIIGKPLDQTPIVMVDQLLLELIIHSTTW
ncbi:hypothetical protein Tco_0717919 [Tanacetum coccineum]